MLLILIKIFVPGLDELILVLLHGINSLLQICRFQPIVLYNFCCFNIDFGFAIPILT